MVLRNMVNAAARRSMGCLLFAFKTVPPRPGKCRISILMRGLQSCCWQAAYFHQLPDGTHEFGGSADAPTPCPIVLRRLENGGGADLTLAGFSVARFLGSGIFATHCIPIAATYHPHTQPAPPFMQSHLRVLRGSCAI